MQHELRDLQASSEELKAALSRSRAHEAAALRAEDEAVHYNDIDV